MERRDAIRKTGILAGSAVAVTSLMPLLQSCQSESRLDWTPLFFNEEEAKTIAALVDTILPRTDTPGALDVKADIFLDRVIAKTYEADGQQNFRDQIIKFNKDCQEQFGHDFYELNKSDKKTFLQKVDASSGSLNGAVWGTAVGVQEPVGFYRSIKSMAIWAYLSSEEIGKNVLSYDPIPTEYKGCIDLSDVGNKWSL